MEDKAEIYNYVSTDTVRLNLTIPLRSEIMHIRRDEYK